MIRFLFALGVALLLALMYGALRAVQWLFNLITGALS